MLHAPTSRFICLIGAVVLGLGALSTRAQAQERPHVSVGERIRWTHTEAPRRGVLSLLFGLPTWNAKQPVWIAGTLIERTADTLVVEVLPGASPARVPINSVGRLDARRRSAQRLVVPSLVGAGAGAIGGALLARGCWAPCAPPTRTETFEWAAAGAVTGAMAGASYGLFDLAGNPWERVRLPARPRVASGGNGRIVLSTSVRF